MLASPGSRGAIARGLGRSYGDAAQNAGGTVVATAALDHMTWSDEAAGLLAVGSGTSLDTILRALVPRGWFVPVSPGTRWVSVGGAIAADVHGKNHHAEGSFASHVTSLTLATPAGIREVTPSDDPDLFWATAGGMGLTGIILGATLRMLPIETSRVRVVTERAADLDDVMARMSSGDAGHRYSVAWIDCLAQGRTLGRSVLTRGDHARLDELPRPRGRIHSASIRRAPFRAGLRAGARQPDDRPVLQRGLVPQGEVPCDDDRADHGFFHPLDAVRGWNRLYGPGGFVQYQFVVPFSADAVVERILGRLSALRLPSFLAVLKRFGPADPGPLSFPCPAGPWPSTSRRASAASRGSSTPSTSWWPAPAAACTWRRTPGCGPTCSPTCTRASASGWRCGTAWIRRASSNRTWPAAGPHRAAESRMNDALGAPQSILVLGAARSWPGRSCAGSLHGVPGRSSSRAGIPSG